MRYDRRCLNCGREWERVCAVADRYAPCEECGGSVEQIWRHSVQNTPFPAYFDYGLGVEVTSLGQRHALMREYHLDYRDKKTPGDQSARQDRIREQERERAR